jgi:glycine cleavage system H protein
METLVQDPFATKGVEYLICLAFLGSLPASWRHLNGAPPAAVRERLRAPVLSGWFELPRSVLFHPAHAWGVPSGPRRWRLGLDDFAQKVLGGADAVELPPVGAHLGRGERAWTLDVDGKRFDMPAPVAGRVVARNEAVIRSPGLLNGDPYGAGWLLEVEPQRWSSGIGAMLDGGKAREWLARVESALRVRMSPELGVVLQDGGIPVSGIARALSETEWEMMARELLAPR